MSEFQFGLGYGKVSGREKERAKGIARKHGAEFVAYRGLECVCGRGCRNGCNHRYWFTAPNRGEPFDSMMVRAVLAEVGEVRSK